MEQKKVLPIGDAPIKTYLHHAYRHSILSASDLYLPWLYSNYIQIQCSPIDEEYKHINIEYFMHPNPVNYDSDYPCPFLCDQPMLRFIIDKYEGGLLQFVIDSIDKNFYVQTYVDEYYIPDRWAYGQTHFGHSILIYGYDKGSSELYIMGYTRNMSYGSTAIPMDLFVQADRSFSQIADNWIPYITLFDFHYNLDYFTKMVSYKFDTELVYDFLNEYLHSKDSSYNHRMIRNRSNHVFGMDVYKYVDKYLDFVYEEQVQFDARVSYLVYEHKVCMSNRIQYMQQHGFLKGSDFHSRYKDVEREFTVFKNLMHKCSITRDKSLLRKAQEKLKYAIEKEYTELTAVVKGLE